MPHKVEEWPDEKLFSLIDRLYGWDTRQEGHKYKIDHRNQLFAALRSPLMPKRILERYVVDRFLTGEDMPGLPEVALFRDWLHTHGYAMGEHEWSGHHWKKMEYQTARNHADKAFEAAVAAHGGMVSELDQVGLTQQTKDYLKEIIEHSGKVRALIAGMTEPEE